MICAFITAQCALLSNIGYVTCASQFWLHRYTVVPSKAAAFIEEMKAAKEGAKASDGFVAYDVIKTVVCAAYRWHLLCSLTAMNQKCKAMISMRRTPNTFYHTKQEYRDAF